jgi:hypothetical protein
MNYKLFLVNLGWYSSTAHKTLEDAKKAAQSSGYEVRIDYHNPVSNVSSPIMSYSYMRGWSCYIEEMSA